MKGSKGFSEDGAESELLHEEAMEEEYAKGMGRNLPFELAIAHICLSSAASAKLWVWRDGMEISICPVAHVSGAPAPMIVRAHHRVKGVRCLQGRVRPFHFFF